MEMIRARQITPADNAAVREVWADAMLGHGIEQANEFVKKRYDDPRDMGDAFANFVRPAGTSSDESGPKNFWVVERIKIPPSRATTKIAREGDGGNGSCSTTPTGNITTSALATTVPRPTTGASEPEVVGCVGALLRDGEDMAARVPRGKEYLQREEADTTPLWGQPLGIGSSPAVELVRMAVREDARGKTFLVEDAGLLVGENTCSCQEEQERRGSRAELKVSQLLAAQVAAWAKEQNVEFVVLTTASAFLGTVKAYERLGFSARKLPVNTAFSARADELLKRMNWWRSSSGSKAHHDHDGKSELREATIHSAESSMMNTN